MYHRVLKKYELLVGICSLRQQTCRKHKLEKDFLEDARMGKNISFCPLKASFVNHSFLNGFFIISFFNFLNHGNKVAAFLKG